MIISSRPSTFALLRPSSYISVRRFQSQPSNHSRSKFNNMTQTTSDERNDCATSDNSELAAALAELALRQKEVQDLEARIAALRAKPVESEPQNKPAKKVGQLFRKGRKEKGGVNAPDCFEERMWDPKEVMAKLGYRPIGHIRTCFPRKNGCPRQGSVCPASQASLDLQFSSNPHYGSEGLEDFSHVWLIFLFHDNGTAYTPRPFVNPPRLNGVRKGVFATRSPHRPNPIGLSLCRLDEVRGRSLYLSGIDLVDGTPILDVKPYLPPYDFPCGISPDGGKDLASEWLASHKCAGDIRYPGWALPSEESSLNVSFSEEAEQQLRALEAKGITPRLIGGWDGVRQALRQVLQADPRSVYRKVDQAAAAEEFSFYLDCLDVRCLFSADSDAPTADGAGAGDVRVARRAVRVVGVHYVSLDAQRASLKAGGCAGGGEGAGGGAEEAAGGAGAGAGEAGAAAEGGEGGRDRGGSG